MSLEKNNQKNNLEIPKRIERIRKFIRKYEEQVNKCDIQETNTLAYNIGSDIDYLKFSYIRTTEQQKNEIKLLEDQFITNMDNLIRCRCIKKTGK